MDKGWGLALDSCPSPTLPPFFHPSSSSSASSKLHPHTPSLKPFRAPNERMFPLLGFPVNLTRPNNNKEEHDDDDNNNHRKVVGEVDFFSDRTKTTTPSPPPGHDHVTNPNNIVSIKKENIHPNDEKALNVNTGLQLVTGNTGSDQSTVDDGVSSDAEDKRAKSTELAMLQVELQRMNAENQKLKEMLTHVGANYTALQMHLATLMQHHRTSLNEKSCEEKKPDVGGVMGARQFLDLVPDDQQVSNSSSDERTRSSTPQNNSNTTSHHHHEVTVMRNNGKTSTTEMGREESPDSESQGWAPNKQQKLNPSSNSNSNAMDQSSSEATMRKARVSVRARSEAPMISDGCQWRKYGQKMAKGNPCPRAYYRCTMAVGCPVRKQVQRCAEDRTILVTTYEGTHNHPLPPAAMAMASTTSAAASMLLSGSMSSADGIMNPNLLARAILPCSSTMATLSASAPFPTVTLDLTHNPASSNPLQQAQIRPPPHHHPAPLFQVPFQGHPQNNFGTEGVGVGGGALYNQSRFSGLQLSHEMGSSQLALQASRPPLQQQNQLQQQPSLADSVTAAITTDPNFTAVLAAAISSIIGSGGAHPNNNHNTNSNVTNKSTTISNLSGN